MTPRSRHTQHIRIEKQSIRSLFYIGSISTLVLLAVALSVLYTRSIKTELENKIDQLSTGIIEEKKLFLRNAVERTFYLIEQEKARDARRYAEDHLSPQRAESLTKSNILSLIRGLRLVDNGYIWVNQVVDYNGGDNYAIRAVHPNLPQTEGMWLSTNTTDIKGNRPYEEELNGIKEHGELFFDYYFKKIDSDEITHKLSFAKLYKPYDWIVATGVYLDDVDQLIHDETARMEETSRRQLVWTLSISLILVILGALVIAAFDKHISRLIQDYETRIHDYTASLERLSVTDRLTGLFNRLKLEDVFSYEVDKAHRYGNVFSILLLDLDRFKSVNDTYGHLAGDNVLEATADILKRHSRKTDTVGRWGGEEFLIIMPETDAARALAVAGKIREAIAAHSFPAVGTVTCSIGVSSFRTGDSKESLTERADKALYCAKHEGRDTVVCEQPTAS